MRSASMNSALICRALRVKLDIETPDRGSKLQLGVGFRLRDILVCPSCIFVPSSRILPEPSLARLGHLWNISWHVHYCRCLEREV